LRKGGGGLGISAPPSISVVSTPDPKQIVADGYDAIADRFAAWQQTIRGDARMRYLDELLRRLPTRPEILELGCGAGGDSTKILASRGRLVGVDISEEQVERAWKRVPEATFIKADVTSLDLPSGSFDAVVAFFVLAHIPLADLPGLLTRIANWLRPEGWFLATMGSRGRGESVEPSWLGVPMFFSSVTRDESQRLVRDAGLEIVADEVVVQHEPGHGDVEFLWVLARKER
jgi:ubiquinone/menaquinone biosynthesis C-methylase UbiE